MIKAPTCNLDHGKDSIAIMAHIRQKAIEDPYHDLVRLYLEEYYWFNKRLPGYKNSKFAHKAMYPHKSSQWLQAKEFETRHNTLVEAGVITSNTLVESGVSSSNTPVEEGDATSNTLVDAVVTPSNLKPNTTPLTKFDSKKYN